MAGSTDPGAARTWVAIDMTKGWNVALVEYPDGRQQRFRFRHCREDYDARVGLLRAAADPCRVALEPTADYHRTLGYRLLSEGFDLALVSAVAGASKTYHHIARARTRLQHVLITHYLTLYWPEIERFWSTQINEWFIGLLMRFPTPRQVTALTMPEFVAEVWKLMGRRVHKRERSRRSMRLPLEASRCRSPTTPRPSERFACNWSAIYSFAMPAGLWGCRRTGC